MEKRMLKLKKKESLLNLNEKSNQFYFDEFYFDQFYYVASYVSRMIGLLKEYKNDSKQISLLKGAIEEQIKQCHYYWAYLDLKNPKKSKKAALQNSVIITELRKLCNLLNDYNLYSHDQFVEKLKDFKNYIDAKIDEEEEKEILLSTDDLIQLHKELVQLDKAEKVVLQVIDQIEQHDDYKDIIFSVGRYIYECKNDDVSTPSQKSKFAKFRANKSKELQNQLLISELRRVVDLLNENIMETGEAVVKKLNALRWDIKDRKVINTSSKSNCLRTSLFSTSKRNSVLEQLYKESKKTPSEFVEEMRELARSHSNRNLSIARVVEFEKYLKSKEYV